MSIEAMRELKTLASVCPELNMANYGEDDVRHLNDWAIEMSLLVEKVATGEPVMDVRCEGCGYMTHHREHMGCVRAAKQHTNPATGEPVGYMNEGHIHELAMGRIPYGYVYPEDGAGASTAVYTHLSPSVPADVVRDAERYRFIRDADVSDDLIPDIALYAMESLDEYIDAAMLAAK